MGDDVWGVEEWGLKNHSDHKPNFSKDPVCGRAIDETKAHEKTGYAGRMYYFCSVDCRTKFEENPGAYIGQSTAPRGPSGH